MESYGRKRKGPEISLSIGKSLTPLTDLWSHMSLGDYSRQKKRSKEDEAKELVGSIRSVVEGNFTAPPGKVASMDPLCRGLKRKIGCIDRATQLGRKKKIAQEYDLGAKIGHGKFGCVVLCRSRATGEEFACKMLRKREELVHQEVEIMQHLSGHSGIVTLNAVYEDLESFYLVMELCHGGRLLDQMTKEGQYSEHRAANILRDLILVIKYCHDMGVVHRDIKPENILLTASGQMKLADFGLAVRVTNGQNLNGVVGSPAYVAPEVLAGNYSEKVDIWSAGVLLHALLVGFLPFQGGSLAAVFDAIKKGSLDFTSGLWDSVSQPAQDLVAHMLTRDVSARLTADEVLKHPWIVFYTEPTLEALTLKPVSGCHGRHGQQKLTATPPRVESKTSSYFLHNDSTLISLSDVSSSRLEEQDCRLIDALTTAISRVRISESKRSRLCGPAIPIKQECSSNMTVNSLCTAF
ncbi:hypothetical protein Tsubulata_034175 [Turnera subulata]|uniref:Protein kinase domain-containing protein n=1 Tax=Turnera subulata TaxID=218843 RepID=A0A9Q0JP59_9ROSI|nr:hypothetical protein Tsubulata_034175 [Turnera subulata]